MKKLMIILACVCLVISACSFLQKEDASLTIQLPSNSRVIGTKVLAEDTQYYSATISGGGLHEPVSGEKEDGGARIVFGGLEPGTYDISITAQITPQGPPVMTGQKTATLNRGPNSVAIPLTPDSSVINEGSNNMTDLSIGAHSTIFYSISDYPTGYPISVYCSGASSEETLTLKLFDSSGVVRVVSGSSGSTPYFNTFASPMYLAVSNPSDTAINGFMIQYTE